MEPFNSILNLYKELGHKPDIFSFIPESGMQEAYVGRCLNCDMDLRYLYKLGEADCVRGFESILITGSLPTFTRIELVINYL
jgi:hypothetical protein